MAGIACYCRASTEDQSLERHLTATREYADCEFGVALGDLEIYRDKSTRTNTDCLGYQKMFGDADAGGFTFQW